MQIPNITFERAVEWAGSQSELSRRMGVTASAVNQWKVDGLPEGRVWQLAMLGCPTVEQPQGVAQ